MTGAANVINDDILSLIYTDGPAAPDYVLHKLSYGVRLVVEDGTHVSRLAWTGRSYRKIIRNVAYIYACIDMHTSSNSIRSLIYI